MRDIKFRAWDNENEYMITSKQGVFTALQSCMNITRQDNGYYNNGDLLKPNKEKYTLMQYTGLKDKNGKEIYEGDIVQTEELRAVVEYSEIYAEYITTHTNQIQYEDEPLGDLRAEEIEVIGNIYDNPDLLEKGAEE